MRNRERLPLRGDIVVVRGGGDLATGVVQKFVRAGMRVLVLELAEPMAIRRGVSLCGAVWDGAATVEDITARRVESLSECEGVWARGEAPMLVDEGGAAIAALRPDGVIDAVLAKKNVCGTRADMAPIVVALGPGFSAPEDAHAVIETMRGHCLGRVICQGAALPNTGVPGEIGGQSDKRVLRAPQAGEMELFHDIGDRLRAGEPVFAVAGETVTAPFDGILRGVLRAGTRVRKGLKSADIDPRLDSDCFTISDKARSIGGGALEAYLALRYRARSFHKGDVVK